MSIKVMLVDDSAVIRGLMAKALSVDPDIVIAATAAHGQMAIDQAREIHPEVIVLDIEMPVMDGITALPELLKVSPESKIIIASTLTRRNAAIGLQALELGAADCLAKPSSAGGEAENFYRELLVKVKALGSGQPLPIMPSPAVPAAVEMPSAPDAYVPSPAAIQALAIAASTGGPQALVALFTQLQGRLRNIPIFITQHMPPTFTTILAEHLAQAGQRPCGEGRNGERVEAGHAYIAPGDYHMLIERDEHGYVTLRLNQDAPENFCRPAADPMLRSLSCIYGKHLAVAVLTGMGHDGLAGARDVVAAGGVIIAQDAASSVVYGMPKAVAENKLCEAVLPLKDIGNWLVRRIEGGA